MKKRLCIQNILRKSCKASESGLTSRMLFGKEGLSVHDLSKRRIKSALSCWRKMSHLEDGPKDTRKTNSPDILVQGHEHLKYNFFLKGHLVYLIH